jgi:hypothetical protein
MAGNSFLMDFLKRSNERKVVLGPSKEGEDMSEVPKERKGKVVKKDKEEKEKPCENPVHTAIRDDRWNREKIIEYLKTLL